VDNSLGPSRYLAPRLLLGSFPNCPLGLSARLFHFLCHVPCLFVGRSAERQRPALWWLRSQNCRLRYSDARHMRLWSVLS